MPNPETNPTTLAFNWKSAILSPDEARDSIDTYARARDAGLFVADSGLEVVVFVPTGLTNIVAEGIKNEGLPMSVGVQNIDLVADEENPQETGANTAKGAKALGATSTLIRHLEVRARTGENAAQAVAKILAARNAGLKDFTVVERIDEVDKLVSRLDHEPLGTIAQERRFINGGFQNPSEAKRSARIVREAGGTYLHVGGVNPENVGDYLGKRNVDGVLIGHGSANPHNLINIYTAAINALKD